jgi:hypothetical protein
VTTTEWAAIFTALGDKTPAVTVLLGIFLGGRLLLTGWRMLLIGLAAGVAIFDSNEDRRADALEVLQRLLLTSRRERSRNRVPMTLPQSGDDGRPPEQAASARQIAQVHPKHRV